MQSSRLQIMIEKHAEQLTNAVVQELRSDTRTPSYHNLDRQDDQARVYAVVRNLGQWLDRESDRAMEAIYRDLGRKRFLENIPLAEVVLALTLTKQTITHFIQAEGWIDSALDLTQQLELYTLISRFFDRAIYFTVLSYEAEARSAERMAPPPESQKKRFASGLWAS